MWISHVYPFIIHQGDLSCFHFLVFTNNAAVNVGWIATLPKPYLTSFLQDVIGIFQLTVPLVFWEYGMSGPHIAIYMMKFRMLVVLVSISQTVV